MSSEDPGTIEEDPSGREPRPIVFSTVKIPLRVMYLTAAALLGAAGLAMISALIRAITYSESSQGSGGPDISQPTLSFADRLSIFTNNGAGIVVAILVALAVALAAIADPPDDRADRLGLVIVVVSSLAAAVIVALNAILFVEILINAQGIFLANETANKASSAIAQLEPILLALGAIGYSASRLKADWDDVSAGQVLESPDLS